MSLYKVLPLLFTAFVSALPTQHSSQNYDSLKRNLYSNNFGIPGVNETFDYVVIGGGNAGLVVAKRLAEDPTIKVAVIEAGGFYEDAGNTTDVPAYSIKFDGMAPDTAKTYPTLDWGVVTTPQVGLYNNTYHYSRGKALGGCTIQNGMIYHRATTESYEKWASAVGDDSYLFDNFLPYYTKSTNLTLPQNNLRAANASIPVPPAIAYSSTGGPLHTSYEVDSSVWSSWAGVALTEAGLPVAQDFLTGTLNGVQYTPGTINPDTRVRDTSQTSFLQAQFDTGTANLKVYINTLAMQILFDGNKTAVGVKVETAGVSYVLQASKEVILSAGAFNSPQLLMLSGIGPKATLDKFNIPVVADRPGVGQNMWDQPLFGIAHAVDLPLLSGVRYTPGASDAAVAEYLANATGPLTRYISYLGWEKLPDRSGFDNQTSSDLASFPADWPEVEYLALNDPVNAGSNPNLTYASVGVSLMTTTSRGTVSLASNSIHDLPVVNPNWLATSTDKQLALAAFRRIRQFFSTPSISAVLIGDNSLPTLSAVSTDEEILRYIAVNFSTIWHAAGTCKMGLSNDSMAVVDSKARVYGVNGLRVVDASALPFLPPGHPMSTIYALGEKISDDIKNGS